LLVQLGLSTKFLFVPLFSLGKSYVLLLAYSFSLWYRYLPSLSMPRATYKAVVVV